MRAPASFIIVCFAILVITPIATPGGAAHAQGSTDASIEKQIQAALANAGFDPGPVDGKLGPKTRRAIQAWQRANGYAETGVATRDQLKSILMGTPLTATLEPKCAKLPGQYLAEKHAECWEEAENQPGCFVWDTHYHSDRTTKWTGQCQGGVAEGDGTYSVSAGSNHSSYEGTGAFVSGKTSGYWIVEWTDGKRYEGEWRNRKPHGVGTLTMVDGTHYQGEWSDGKLHGIGSFSSGASGIDGVTWENYEGEYRDGEHHGKGTYHWFSKDKQAWYEGEWRDGKPHGEGSYTEMPIYRHYSGQWRYGCSGRDGRSIVWLFTTKASCGF